MKSIKERNSNIELLRIVAMLMIIEIHYFASCDAGSNAIPWSENWIVFHVMESLGICGVNLFVLITGYFSLEQKTIKIRKIVNLLIDVAFWGGIGFLLCILVGWKSFGVKDIIKTMFPVFFGGRWFVKTYIVLLCLIPFVNIVLKKLTKSSYRLLVITLTILFSLWPSFLPNPPIDDYGYGFVHFVLLYVIAGYIRLHVEKYPPKWICILGFFVSAGAVCISSLYENNYAWAYNYIFVIMEAVCLLLFFIQVEVKSKLINSFAACAFGVFLIHTDGFFSKLIYGKLLHCNELVSGKTGLFILSILASMPTFYSLGYALESAKKKLFAVSIYRLLDKLKILNKPIEIVIKSHES